MTDHYRLTVVELKPPTVVVEFRCVHPDYGHPPAERNVAAQALIEGWVLLGRPEHPCGGLLQKLQDMAEGAEVEVPEEDYRPMSVGQWWQDGDRYYRKSPPDLVSFIVKSRRLFRSLSYERLDDSPPVGHMKMLVKNPQTVSHLTEGMQWNSVIFDLIPYLGQV